MFSQPFLLLLTCLPAVSDVPVHGERGFEASGTEKHREAKTRWELVRGADDTRRVREAKR